MARRALRLSLSYLPLLLGCAAIFAVSSMPRPPIPELLLFPHSDKVMHAMAYCVLGVLALVGASARVGSPGRAAGMEAAAVCMLYGLSDELHQSFVPGRSLSAADWLADSVGALLGAFVVGHLLLEKVAARRARLTPRGSAAATTGAPAARSSARRG